MQNKDILKKLYNHFDNLGFCTDYDNGLLFVHHSLCTICIEEENELALSFEVTCETHITAHITKIVIEFAWKNKYNVEIYEPYAFVLSDDNEIILEVIHGEEALLYHATGDYQVKEQKPEAEVKKEDKVDVQKEVDTILDQINTKGMKSLNKHQKELLVNFSKGNIKHNH